MTDRLRVQTTVTTVTQQNKMSEKPINTGFERVTQRVTVVTQNDLTGNRPSPEKALYIKKGDGGDDGDGRIHS